MKQGIYLLAFTFMALITACSSDDDVIGGGEESRGKVKTEFMISFPAKVSGNTRMSAATVQAAGSAFRGIQDIRLYPFYVKVDVTNNTPALSTAIPDEIGLQGTGSSTTSSAPIIDPSAADNNQIAASGALFTGNNGHLYQDIEVPIGTRSFMFYGRGGLTIPNDEEGWFTDGTMNHNLDAATTLGDIVFSPKQITTETPGADGTNSKKIADYLTTIANAKYTNVSDHYWRASNNVVLGTLYLNFITMHAGSWTNVKAALQQLYTTLYSKTFASADDTSMKTAIIAAILNATYATDSEGGSADGVLEFKDNAVGNYPADIHLPDGAAFINWNSSETKFEATNFPGPQYDSGTVLAAGTSLYGYYVRTGSEGSYTYTAASGTADGTTTYYKSTRNDNTGLDVPQLDRYVYPAPLYYRALSNIRTAPVSKADCYTREKWSGGSGANDDVLDGYGPEVTSGDHQNDMVKFSTRSIAIVDQVQYAVGRLDVTVRTPAETLSDNRALLADFTADKWFYLTRTESGGTSSSQSVNNFPVTGILIGNQKAVDYEFHQKDGGTIYTIYDKTIPEGVCLTNAVPTAEKTIRTLVFESKDATAANQPDAVTKFAVEFVNNSGEWFAGKDGQIIYPGTKFYLVGVFDPWLNETVKYVGTDTLIKKSFVQDYVTTAQLTINSLKNAYNTLPDLRAPQLELGLSIDLNWEQGITQTIIIP